MKVLFTIEEYRSKIIDIAIKTAKQSIKKNAIPFLKTAFVTHIINECTTWHIGYKDEYNALFFSVFGYDRQGNKLTDNINISEEECEEFNSQKWYVDYNSKNQYNPYHIENHFICNNEKELIYYNLVRLMAIIISPFEDNKIISEIVDEVLKNI